MCVAAVPAEDDDLLEAVAPDFVEDALNHVQQRRWFERHRAGEATRLVNLAEFQPETITARANR